MALATGKKAPTFTLKSKNAEGLQEISPSDHLGEKKVLLLFFPFAFTSVCTEEMCHVNDSLSAYSHLNAKVYGISVDSPFAQEQMAQVHGLQFPLLSDFNKEVSAAYEVLYEELLGFKGVSKRSAFVIDENGVIIYSESSEDPKSLPNFEAIKATLT